MTVYFKLQISVVIAFARISQRLPVPLVPDNHFPRAVLAVRDSPFKVGIGNRMIFDVDSESFIFRIETRSLRQRPAFHGAVQLQPEIVMQTTSPVFLDDKST